MVLATKGHIKDLPPKEYGIDIKDDFRPTYEWLKGKKALFSSIKKTAKISTEVFIASDPDREGEMIAEHIANELVSLKAKKHRIRLREINKLELLHALNSPGKIDEGLVDSQICRRLIDRIYGFEISQLLWRDIKIPGLSAGRVQSAVLKWICEREIEIRNFIPEAYVNLKAQVKYRESSIELTYHIKQSDETLDLKSALAILSQYGLNSPGPALSNTFFKLKSYKEKEYKVKPASPFTTASLQETASKVLGLSPSKTMKLAQSLFEGKNIAGEMKGLITYMRTDSTRISEEKKDKAIRFLKASRPDLTIGLTGKTKSKLHAQEAHEAILPSDPSISPEMLSKFLATDEWKLYQLIWQRMMESLLSPEVGKETEYLFEAKGEMWSTKLKEVSSAGFKNFSKKYDLPKDPLKGIKIGDEVECEKFSLEEKKTSPKERYTEGQLIAKMESTGIGRPSTYSQTIETLKKRKYILEVKRKIGATALGEIVYRYLNSRFTELLTESFTSEMEKTLDALAHGTGDKVKIISDFYFRVMELKQKKGNVSSPNSGAQEIPTNKEELAPKIKKRSRETELVSVIKESGSRICPVCGEGSVRSKFSKKGKTIYFCSRYPQCDFVSYEPM